MAPREKLTLAGAIFGVFGTLIWILLTWGGLDLRGTGYEWLGFVLGLGLFGAAAIFATANASTAPEDDREIRIGLKADQIALRAGVCGMVTLFAMSGGVWGPIPGGGVMCLMMGVLTSGFVARLYYYRRGV